MGKNGFTYRVLQKYSIKFEDMISLLLKICQNRFGFLLLSMAIVMALGGCDAEEPCISKITNRFRINFLSPGPEGENVKQLFYFDSVKAIDALQPVFTSKAGSGIESLDLTLNPNADITTYVFYYEGGEQDTMQLAYSRRSRMISPDCGVEISFTDIVVLKEPFAGNEAIDVDLLTNEILDTNKGANMEVVVRNKNCEPVESSLLRLGFYQKDNTTGETSPQARNFRRVIRKGSDQVFYSSTPGAAGIETLDVNLNPGANEVTYTFEYQTGEGDSDELTLIYDRKFSVQSVFCLPDVQYENIRLKSTTFDEVQIVTPDISEPTEQINVKIID